MNYLLMNASKTILLFTFLFTNGFLVFSQQQAAKSPKNQLNAPHNPCGFDHLHAKRMQVDSVYARKTLEFNKKTSKNGPINKVGQGDYRIPVVVHVMNDGTSLTQITDEQIRQAIRELNNRFRKASGTQGFGNGVDMKIEFSLAVRDPNGNCTNGIVRYNLAGNPTYAASGVFYDVAGISDSLLKTYSVWDQTKFYNIWLVSEIDNNNGGAGVQGYAFFASSHGSNIDGAVIMASNFKNPASSTTAHELGHALNLYHTFEGDNGGTTCPQNTTCNLQGDLVCDTPPHIRSASDCVVGSNACDGGSSSNLFIHNYMDYASDICQSEFTAGQKTRATSALTGSRASFLAANGNLSLVPPGTATVDFVSSTSLACAGTSIQFYDHSSCIPNTFMDTTFWSGITFNWTFNNNLGTSINSTLQNPRITFTVPGTYDVTLTITNANGTSTLTEQGFIVITSPSVATTCNPISTSISTLTYGIFQVHLNSLHHYSGSTNEDNVSGLTTSGYANLSCTQSTVLKPSTTYQISLKGTSNVNLSENFKAYIDYNNDGDFIDAGEEISAWNAVAGSGNLLTANFTTPGNPSLNSLLKMRVLSARDTEPITTPCITTTRGQCHDFGVFISNKVAGVSIVASPSTTISYGTNVTLTATPSNGGTSPSYSWYVNGAIVSGQTSPTLITNTLLNGDVVTCQMVSNLSGVIGSPAISNALTFVVTGPPLSEFSADTLICAGSTVTFSDESLLSPNAWSWTYNGGTPATSTLQNPVITYTTPGVYAVTLVASNGLGTGTTMTKSAYIHVFASPGTVCVPTSRANLPTTGNQIGITMVKLNSISKSTLNTDNVYQNYVCTDNTQLVVNSPYTITVGVGTVNSQWTRVYIDYNNDNIFQTATETVFSLDNQLGAVTSSFTVPGTAVQNTMLRMRVISDFSSTASAQPCKNPMNYGQVEDYGVVIVNNCTLPSTPGAISGTTSVCSGSVGNVYSIASVPGATSYTWTVPVGASVSAGQGTTSATVTFGSTAGNVSVTATNTCGTSASSSQAITLNIVPVTPGIITGTSTVCSGSSSNVYSIASIPGATSYTWTVPAGASVSAGQGTTSATVTFGSTAGNVSVTATNSCGTSASSSQAITLNAVPATPGIITGTSTVCSGSSGNVYSIASVPGATSYTWTVPAGASISAGQGTTSATVTFGSTAGNVSVTATNTCGTSASSSQAITLNIVPVTPGIITGTSTVCSGSSGNVYSIASVPGATSYTWTVPAGASISAGQGTTSATVTYGSTAGNVSVTATNSCGTSASSSQAITLNQVPATPGIISGTATACSGSAGNVYSIASVPGATSYTWTVPAGASVSAGQGTTTATVTFGATAGNVSVTATNSCGTSASSSQAITLNQVPATPGLITGIATVCSGSSGNVYSIASVLGATSYTWAVPSGASISAGQGTTSATVTFGSTAGNVSVTATNSCGTSASSSQAITLNAVPATPGIITGSSTACSGSSGNVYSIASIAGATSYTWTVPAGASVSVGQGTTGATVTFGSTAGNVSVTANNACGSSAASSKSITINSTPSTPGIITGTSTVCSGSSGNVYSIASVPGATSYTWTVPSGASISAGQGTTSATVTFGSTAGNVSVTATNSCGTSASSSQAITLNAVPATPGIITGTSTVCSGSSGNVYSIASVPGATSYTWTVPAGASVSAGQGSTQIALDIGQTGGDISVIAENACGASAVSSLLLSVLSTPNTPTIIVSDTCGFSSLSVTSNGLAVWSTGDTALFIQTNSAGTYSVTIEENGCVSQAASANANPLSIPETLFSPINDVCINTPAFQLTGGSPVGGTYSGTAVTNGSFDPSVAGFGSFDITYAVISSEGCIASSVQSILVGCADMTEVAMQVEVYPNPTNGEVNIHANHQIDYISVRDQTGRLVYTLEIESLKMLKLDFSFLASGIYDIRAFSKDRREEVIHKLLKY
jgi:PKD repeat protein